MKEKMRYRMQMLHKLKEFAYGVKKLFVIKFISGVALLCTSLIVPLLYSVYIERVILGKDLSIVGWVVAAYVTVQLVNTGMAFLVNYCTYRMNGKVTVAVRLKILDNKLKQDFSKYDNVNAGNEKMVLDDSVFKLCDFSGVQSTDYFINFIKMLVLLIALALMEWRLALVLVLAIPTTFWLNHRNGVKAKKNNDESWENDQAWGDWIYNSTWAWREIRAMNMEN